MPEKWAVLTFEDKDIYMDMDIRVKRTNFVFYGDDAYGLDEIRKMHPNIEWHVMSGPVDEIHSNLFKNGVAYFVAKTVKFDIPGGYDVKLTDVITDVISQLVSGVTLKQPIIALYTAELFASENNSFVTLRYGVVDDQTQYPPL